MGNSYKFLSVGLLLWASHSRSDVTLHSSLWNKRLNFFFPHLCQYLAKATKKWSYRMQICSWVFNVCVVWCRQPKHHLQIVPKEFVQHILRCMDMPQDHFSPFWMHRISSLKCLCDGHGLYRKTIRNAFVWRVFKHSFIILLFLLMGSFLLKTGWGTALQKRSQAAWEILAFVPIVWELCEVWAPSAQTEPLQNAHLNRRDVPCCRRAEGPDLTQVVFAFLSSVPVSRYLGKISYAFFLFN